MESVRNICKLHNIKFTINNDALFGDFDRKLNENIPKIFTDTALEFLNECLKLHIRISEVQVIFGGYKFLFVDSPGDVISHKLLFDAYDGRLESINFEFDDEGIISRKPKQLATLIAEELGNFGEMA